MFKRWIRKWWNELLNKNVTKEEYTMLRNEFDYLMMVLCDEANMSFARWTANWDHKHPKNRVAYIRKGSFAENVFGQYIADRMNEVARRINERNPYGRIDVTVRNENGKPMIIGSPREWGYFELKESFYRP